jgi:hypothetical protein
MKRLVCALFTAGLALFLVPVLAEEAKTETKPHAPKEHKADTPKPEPKEMSLTGTITKEETARTTKEGEKVPMYVLTDGAGNKTKLTKAAIDKGRQAGAAAIDLETFVNKKVTVKGQGHETVKKTEKGEEKKVVLEKITSIVAAE